MNDKVQTQEEKNEQNAIYLNRQQLNSGFGSQGLDELRALIKEGKPEFERQVNKQYDNGDSVTANQSFKLSEQGLYFWNTYDLILKVKGEEGELKQKFWVNVDDLKENGQKTGKKVNSTFTLKEAYNLLKPRVNQDGLVQGGAVRKNFVNEKGQQYTAWATLDFNDKDEAGNLKLVRHPDYDLLASLKEHPIRELENKENQDRLLSSLERGNRQEVTYGLASGVEVTMHVEAAPRFKSKNVYDQDMNVVRNWQDNSLGGQSKDLKVGQSAGQEQNVKETNAAEVKESGNVSKKNSSKLTENKDKDDKPQRRNRVKP